MNNKPRLTILIILLSLFLINPVTVFAGTKSSDLSALSDEEINQRLRFVEDRLSAGRKHARYWQQGWTGFYSTATVLQGVLAATDDERDDRVYYLFGALKAGLGLGDALLRPLPGRHGADELQALPSETRQKKNQATPAGRANPARSC